MAKYRKEVAKKAADALHKDDKVMYALYVLRILKLNDIMLHNEPYNFGATACFKLNWFNPLALVLSIACMISAIICSIINSVFDVVQHIKHGIIIHFE